MWRAARKPEPQRSKKCGGRSLRELKRKQPRTTAIPMYSLLRSTIGLSARTSNRSQTKSCLNLIRQSFASRGYIFSDYRTELESRCEEFLNSTNLDDCADPTTILAHAG